MNHSYYIQCVNQIIHDIYLDNTMTGLEKIECLENIRTQASYAKWPIEDGSNMDSDGEPVEIKNKPE